MTLYRKYRPQAFGDISGQQHVKQTLINAAKTENIAHAYLFNGPRGTGKTSTARIIAKVLNCENANDGTPCQTCDACKQITSGSLVDIIEIDAASNRGIDEIRDLKETLLYQPSFVKSKVYIIDEVHMLTKEAFNALLKTLEEPPEYVYFILATTELEKIPETIISRCQLFNFRRIGLQDIVERMKYICEQEKIDCDEAGLMEIATQADGGLRDALTLLEQLRDSVKTLDRESVRTFFGMSDKTLLADVIEGCLGGDSTLAESAASKLLEGMTSFHQVYKDVLNAARDYFLDNLKSNQSTEQIRGFIIILEKNYQIFSKSQFPQLALEVTIAEILEGKSRPSTPRQTIEPVRTAQPIKPASTINDMPKPIEVVATPAIEPVEEPKPAIEAQPIITENVAVTGEINFRDLKRSWRKIVESLKQPTLRVALKQAELVSLESGTVNLGVGSEFYYKQLSKAEFVSAIEESIKVNLQHKLSVSFSNQAAKSGNGASNSLDEADREVPQIDNFVTDAKDIFAGL